ncbi:MAG: fatty acid desaturase [Acidobacteria bacterium]|nr:fatty acid desaturase [Acidobacteriota bacterium]
MNWLWAVLVSLGVVQISNVCTTIYLHRCLAHKGLDLHPAVRFLMRVHLWVFTGMSPREWVAVHRKHHHFADEEGDPHSPRLRGLWPILLGNAMYYGREARNPETITKYAPDVVQDGFDRMLFDRGLLGLGISLSLFCAIFGLWLGGLAFLFQAGTYIFLSGVINGVCHTIGYRNYSNGATNLRSVAYLTAGEGLHNNHHQFPSSAKFSMRPGEHDPAWIIIRALGAIGLAQPQRLPAEISQ